MMIVKYDRKLLGRRMIFIRLNANYSEINTGFQHERKRAVTNVVKFQIRGRANSVPRKQQRNSDKINFGMEKIGVPGEGERERESTYQCIQHIYCFGNQCTSHLQTCFLLLLREIFLACTTGTNSNEIIPAESLVLSLPNRDNVPCFKVIISVLLSKMVRPYY